MSNTNAQMSNKIKSLNIRRMEIPELFQKSPKMTLTNNWDRKRMLITKIKGVQNEDARGESKGEGAGSEEYLWAIEDGIDPDDSAGRREFRLLRNRDGLLRSISLLLQRRLSEISRLMISFLISASFSLRPRRVDQAKRIHHPQKT
jgi:hypothetical protein